MRRASTVVERQAHAGPPGRPEGTHESCVGSKGLTALHHSLRDRLEDAAPATCNAAPLTLVDGESRECEGRQCVTNDGGYRRIELSTPRCNCCSCCNLNGECV